jgi:hypothetical protein
MDTKRTTILRNSKLSGWWRQLPGRNPALVPETNADYWLNLTRNRYPSVNYINTLPLFAT